MVPQRPLFHDWHFQSSSLPHFLRHILTDLHSFGWLASKPLGSSCFRPQHRDNRCVHMQIWHGHLGPHAYAANPVYSLWHLAVPGQWKNPTVNYGIKAISLLPTCHGGELTGTQNSVFQHNLPRMISLMGVQTGVTGNETEASVSLPYLSNLMLQQHSGKASDAQNFLSIWT